jgi:predicted permease
MHDARPPRLARSILALLLPRAHRPYALADLDEEFEARARVSPGWARAWYRGQVARSVAPLLGERLRVWRRPKITDRARVSGGRGGWEMGIQGLLRDFAYAARTLAKAPMTVLITVLSLGLGLGAMTTVFTVANGILSPPADWLRDPQSLVTIYTTEDDGEVYGTSSLPDFEDVRTAGALADAAAINVKLLSLEEGDTPEQLIAQAVTPNYFSVTGIRPALGRGFVADEGRVEGGAPVAVLSHDLWMGSFGGDPGILGRTIHLGGRPVTVVGVAPEGVVSRRVPVRPDVWVPLDEAAAKGSDDVTARKAREYLVLGRLKDGATLEELRSQTAVMAERLRRDHHEAWVDDHDQPRKFTVLSERDSRVNPRAKAVLAGVAVFFFGATGLILLIACANVTSLFLVRAVRRGREIAVRLSLGASRRQVVRMLMAEGLLLGVAAGAVGIAFAGLLTGAMRTFSLPINVPVHLDFTPDRRAYAFAFGMALLTSLIFSLVPALRVSRPSLAPALKEGRGTWGRPGRRFKPGSILVVVQFAASLVLVVGAGLFLRSLHDAKTMDLGVDPAGVAITTKAVPDDLDGQGTVQFYRDLESRLAGAPGVSQVALSRGVEMTLLQVGAGASVSTGAADEPPDGRRAYRNAVTPGYLKLLGIPLLRGRFIQEEDGPDDAPVAVVNETFAQRFFPDGDVLGRTFTLTDKSPGAAAREAKPLTLRVVGVAADGTYLDVGDPPTPYVWTSLYQDRSPTVAVTLKGTSAEAMVAALRTGVERAPGEVPVIPPTTYASQLSLQFIHLRLASRMLGWGGALGLFLALIGVYGLVSFTVTQHTRDIAIRRAVGADATAVVRGVVRQGLALAAVGLALGLLMVIPTAQLIRGLLVGVGPADPVSIVGGVVLLAFTAALASFLPARRAARIDPMTSLRQE